MRNVTFFVKELNYLTSSRFWSLLPFPVLLSLAKFIDDDGASVLFASLALPAIGGLLAICRQLVVRRFGIPQLPIAVALLLVSALFVPLLYAQQLSVVGPETTCAGCDTVEECRHRRLRRMNALRMQKLSQIGFRGSFNQCWHVERRCKSVCKRSQQAETFQEDTRAQST